jgi:hypothetical protein
MKDFSDEVKCFSVTFFPVARGRAIAANGINVAIEIGLLKDRKNFPHVSGFALVHGCVLQKTAAGFQSYRYTGALKIYGRAKRSCLRDRIQALFASSVKVEVKGISGWNRLVKRIFAEIPNHYFVTEHIFAKISDQARQDFMRLQAQFVKNPARRRRRLDTFLGKKKKANKK